MYKNRPVRSPIQPHHPAQPVRKMGQEEHPIRERVRKLCKTVTLSADFSEDTSTLSTLSTEGLIAVRCVLSHEGKPIGVGHGSSVISRINRGNERTIFSCFNGALMSAINSACKTLDVLRLEAEDERAATDKTEMNRGTYAPRESSGEEPITPKQRQFLLQLASVNLDEGDREQFAASIDDMTKSEASAAIAQWS